ncbi:TetR family transcriptional regulator, partial [Mesorhizobium sp. M8A.F.Ca.ET.021.01.1.1]
MAFEPVTNVDQKPAAADKPLRADAQRNRDRLVEMAASVFAERGIDASLEE